MQGENIHVEYKERYTPDLKKEVVAFANTEGGTIYIGVQNDGIVVGVDNADAVMLQAAGSFRDAIRPDVMPFVQLHAITMDGKCVVEVEVTPGTNKPYYLSEKGLKPSGVYVRRGSASQPLGEDGIREMLMATGGRSFEKGRSLQQDLTFQIFTEEMNKRGLPCGAAQMQTLGMIGEDGQYTNLALLLSDQCEHTIKAAIYRGSEKEDFQDRKEFSGSLLKQMNEVYQLLELCNRTRATFSGLQRIDRIDYPAEAMREALLNSIVHRDYAFSGSTLVNIYDDRIEFVSLGGLVQGLSMEAIFMGVSQSRNPQLAAIFYRMNLIESYGTGIAKIKKSYRGSRKEPVFESAQGVFRVTLPNRNEVLIPAEKKELSHVDKVLDFVDTYGSITRKQAEEILGLKLTQTTTVLRQMCEQGFLQVSGKGRNTKYIKSDCKKL